MQRLIDGDGLDVAFQPIVDLASPAASSAPRRSRASPTPTATPIPTERCFLDAHAVDMGVELELAVIRLALSCHGTACPRAATSR